ncbi:cytochrome C biogenesis protein [Candidatus Falkowbacteria bacterium CG10_big_fil_rev_8_21_14_0_10_44_15]|uniref:Cytochrome C biogenesis protein n=1 Tax=Candidatus Falkowbacteria bacterium CG10_big_fil_rev_8_21_14_0_10_44_15 TaxID=1974569 RepID=A0A2H0V0H5_9BACT|nr:MAG: cytochrome C biogenesis protein [Candidatus Falkowbacteria bacterium CG10_big_fil_rev_8_21_14_0_10_44_15]
MSEVFTLTIPAFIAGVLTFLAPCTLPLVPGYITFISGVPAGDINNPERMMNVRGKIFFNGVAFVIGFSVIFILLGLLAGLGGGFLIQYRLWLARIGGIFVILFGLFMLNVFKFDWLQREYRFKAPRVFQSGSPFNAVVLGATFALGWTPCIGPILGSILFLASTTATIGQGAWLLFIFSVGLALPFLVVAAGVGAAMRVISRYQYLFKAINVIGGLFLILMGVLMLSDNMALLITYGYGLFNFLEYERLLDYL